MKMIPGKILLLAAVALACAILGAGRPAEAQTRKAGDIILQTGFSGPSPLEGWTIEGEPEAGQVVQNDALGKTALRIVNAKPTWAMAKISLPVEKIRGARLYLRARLRAEDISKPDKPYLGTKIMVVSQTPRGPQYAGTDSLTGTFGPTKVQKDISIPADAESAYLTMGLEGVSGKVWFTDIALSIGTLPRSRPAEPLTMGRADGGHPGIPRLRGTTVGTIDEASLKVLSQDWKANVLRYSLPWGGAHPDAVKAADVKSADAWVATALKRLDSFLPLCEKYNIRVVPILHSVPGGRLPDQSDRLFHDKALQERFLTLWEEIARRYKGRDVIWGFDIMNEPIEGIVDDGLLHWRDLALEAARRINKIDPDRIVIVEPDPGAEAYGFNHFEPLPLKNVVYSVHVYNPHTFTHQGVYNNPEGLSYPGKMSASGETWNRNALKKVLEPVISFQKDYGVPIYVGEFSAIRWAPGNSAFNYVNDLISIFEEQGWDWTYHAFREYEGWSAEHGSDKADTKRAARMTDREMLLRHWFAQNELPSLSGVAPAEVKQVRGEKLKLSASAPKAYHTGTRLKALEPTGPNSGIAARGSLIPQSVVLRSGDTVLEEGKDYLLTHDWGMLGIAPGSRVTPNDTVTADYDYSLLRLDSVVTGADGVKRIKTGVSHISSPLPPEIAPGEKRIANLFIPYRAANKPVEVYPIFETAEQATTLSTPGRIPKTMAKLKAGEPVKIVSWGDSVTAGGEASTPEMRFPNQLQARLREKFKSDKIVVETIAVGGSNSVQWLDPKGRPFSNPARQSELRFERVLEAKPDLVTIEFVNDAYMGQDEFSKRYGEITRRIQETGAEIIFITPHFTAMDMMGFSTSFESERRPYVAMLQKFAADNNIALADASSRWGHLWKEGLPYITLLHNTYNHPDDRGMSLFADELMKCFAAP